MLLHSISLIAGLQPLRLIAAFCIYSVIGWCMESAYMSFCNRKLTNRGFMTGPFCPIYGFGALAGFFLLKGFAENLLLLYVAGAVSATIFEYLVGRLMLKLFGEVWWDYHEKPFNYQGIICLESTVAWGFYAVIIIGFLHGIVMKYASWYTYGMGLRLLGAVLLLVLIDFPGIFSPLCTWIWQERETGFWKNAAAFSMFRGTGGWRKPGKNKRIFSGN